MAGREAAYGGGGGGSGSPNHAKKIRISSDYQPLDCIFASAPSNSFLGSRAMFSFGGANGSGTSFYQSFDPQENGDEYYDDYFNQPEKKKRLSLDQVQFLEKSFEAENKLEPERKTQLANELGLQPRQIAVWFQNRRARWKTKHLETEYETLHASYDSLKTDYDSLLKENEKLKTQVYHLKHNGHAQDADNVNSQLCDAKEFSEAAPREDSADVVKESKLSATACKNDVQSSARCDGSNADGPRWIDGIHPLLFKSGESSHLFEPDHTGSLNEELLQRAYVLPKIDDACFQPYANSCGHGLAVEDHAFGFWSH